MEENKYEEALKRAKLAIEECGDNVGRIKMIESIFPELAESKEENIRKSILRMFKNALPDVFNRYGMNKNDAIAYIEKLKDIDKRLEDAYKTADEVQYKRGYEDGYMDGFTVTKEELERQGEHANFLSKIQVGDKVTRNEDGVFVNLSQLNRVVKKLEKQGEFPATINVDKMVKEFEDFKVMAGRIPSLAEIDAYRKGVNDVLSKVLIKEEKPITLGSKKAEGKLGEMIAASKEPAESGEEDKQLTHSQVSKKSDKDCKWSEEDESKIIDSIFEAINVYYLNYPFVLSQIKDWLKIKQRLH